MTTFNHQHGDYDFHDHDVRDDRDSSSGTEWHVTDSHDDRWIRPTTTRSVDPERQEPTEPFPVTGSELRILLSGVLMILDLYRSYRNIEVRRRAAIAEALKIRIQEALK